MSDLKSFIEMIDKFGVNYTKTVSPKNVIDDVPNKFYTPIFPKTYISFRSYGGNKFSFMFLDEKYIGFEFA
jgi:hypothetical protein